MLPTWFISFQSFLGWKRGLCWKGFDCHLGKKLFGTPLGCVGTKDSRISIWVFPKIWVPPKWMVYNGKPYKNGWFGGKPTILETPPSMDISNPLPKLLGPGFTMGDFLHPQVLAPKKFSWFGLMIFKLPSWSLLMFESLESTWNLWKKKRETENG